MRLIDVTSDHSTKRKESDQYEGAWVELWSGKGLAFQKHSSSEKKLYPLFGCSVREAEETNLLVFQPPITTPSPRYDLYLQFKDKSEMRYWLDFAQSECDADEGDPLIITLPNSVNCTSCSAALGELPESNAKHLSIPPPGAKASDHSSPNVPSVANSVPKNLDSSVIKGCESIFSNSAIFRPQADTPFPLMSPRELMLVANSQEKMHRSSYNEDEDDIDDELLDLQSKIPAVTGKLTALGPKKRNRAYLDTAGFADGVLARILQGVGDFGYETLLKTFKRRLQADVMRPASKLIKLIEGIDADAELIKKTCLSLLAEYGKETAVGSLVAEADQLLRQIPEVRRKFELRRDMALFCEQVGAHGLKLGVKGTLSFFNQICRGILKNGKKRELSVHERTEVATMLEKFDACILIFRMEFDYFDDSYSVIMDMYEASQKTHELLKAKREVFKERKSVFTLFSEINMDASSSI